MSHIIRKSYTFDASHILPNHTGKCSRLHGHTYTMVLELRSEVLVTEGSAQGMVMDFGDISAQVKPFIDAHLDHRHLNDLISNPTAERIAQYCFEYLFDTIGTMLWSVEIRETPTSSAIYAPYA